jgi:hypothetical protein
MRVPTRGLAKAPRGVHAPPPPPPARGARSAPSQLLACLGLIKPMPVLSLSYTRPVLGERLSLGTAAALLACCPATRHSPLCYKQPAARSPQPAGCLGLPAYGRKPQV